VYNIWYVCNNQVNEEERDREGRKPKAVIVGGSIDGISSAHALTLAGWDVIVIEKTISPPTGNPTGAGLALNPLSQQSIHSWISHPQLIHNITVPLTVEQVNIYYLSLSFLFGY